MKVKTLSLAAGVSMLLVSSSFAMPGGADGQHIKSADLKAYGEERMQNVKDFRDERMQDVKDFRDDRRGDIKDLRGDVKEMRQEFRATVSSTTSSSTRQEMRKDLKEDIKMRMEETKDERKDDIRKFKEDRKDDFKMFKEEVRNNMVKNIPAPALAALALKLGVSTTSLQAQIASGSKLRQIIASSSLTKEDLKGIFPPMIKERVASSSVPRFFDRIFGEKKEQVTTTMNEQGEVVEEVVSKSGFFRRFFGF